MKLENFVNNTIELDKQANVKGGWVWPHIDYIYTELELMPYGPEEDFVYNP